MTAARRLDDPRCATTAEALARRLIRCPRCGAAAEVVLRWDPRTAWRANVHRFRCLRGCGVKEWEILRALGLA